MNRKPLPSVDHMKSLYSRYSQIPIPTKVFLPPLGLDTAIKNPSNSLLKVFFNYRDPVQIKNVCIQKDFVFLGDKFIPVSSVHEVSTQIFAQVTNKLGNVKVVIKTKPNDKAPSEKSEQFITVYQDDIPLYIIPVHKLNENMKIVESASYSSCLLSDDGRKLLCVVQIEQPKSNEESPSSKTYNFDSLEYKQSWGEQLENFVHSSIALIHLEPGNEFAVLIEKPGMSLVEPFFYKPEEPSSDIGVGCVGFPEDPYKLGLLYCGNRRSCILSTQVPRFSSSAGPIEPNVVYGADLSSFFSKPRLVESTLDRAGHHVVFLQCDAGGAHSKPLKLIKMCMHSNTASVVVDNKQKRPLDETSTRYLESGPLFIDDLPQYCFDDEGHHIFLSSSTPLSSRPFIINIDSGETNSLPFPLANCEILQVRSNWVVAVGSEPNVIPTLYVAYIKPDNIQGLKWIPVEDTRSKLIPSIKFDTFSFPSRDNPGMLVNCIWTEPKTIEESNGATIFWIHGGPHASFPTAFIRSLAMFVDLGFKLCAVNYVGSTGVDHDYIDALLGSIGSSDVHDCVDAIDYVLDYKKIDPKKLILYGGSHGGFLVTHLSGQYADKNFLACAARNPVIDTPSLITVSDIPDWVCAETLGTSLLPFDKYYPNSFNDLEMMRKTSPLDHIHKVRVPTIVALGTKDLRVPMCQGLLYHKLLKARGVETRCFVYDDGHPLQKINVEFDCFVNVVKFFFEQLEKLK